MNPPDATANAIESFEVAFQADNISQTGTTTSVSASITIPPDVDFVGSASCIDSGATASCTLGEIDAGASSTYSISVSSAVTGSSSFSTTVMGDQFDPNLMSNAAQATVNILPSADLAVVNCLTDSADYASGSTGTLRCSIENTGPQDATDIELLATLPSFTTFTSGTGCELESGSIECGVSNILIGSSADIEFGFRADSPGNMSVPVSASGAEHDPTPANNQLPGPLISVTPPVIIERPDETGGGSISLLLHFLLGLSLFARFVQLRPKWMTACDRAAIQDSPTRYS